MRDPEVIMRPERLAVLQPSRLSASRALMNMLVGSNWSISRVTWDIDERGRGEALYRVDAGRYTFDLVALSFEPRIEGRTARIIGRHWDMMGALLEGPVTPAALEQTRSELPKLYEGRAPEGTLAWARSNRSLRAFDHVVDSLAAGRQPDLDRLAEAGYILRNTGLDGNGTFGTRSFLGYEENHPLRVPYFAQMLAAYLMREFGFDLAESLARSRGPGAVPLDPRLKTYLGLGNGSGLGLILWVHNHPRVVSRWIQLRERAIAHACALSAEQIGDGFELLESLLVKAARHRREDRTRYESFDASELIARDLDRVLEVARGIAGETRAGTGAAPAAPLSELRRRVAPLVSPTAAETLDSLLIELVPEYADALLRELTVSEILVRSPQSTIGELKALIDRQYGWALDLALAGVPDDPRVLYKSRNAEEPRRGPRSEAGEAIDLALHLPTLLAGLRGELDDHPDELSVARFLVAHPRRRQLVERVQALADDPYHTPLMELLGDTVNPAHIIALVNIAFYGLDRTKDHLRRTLRGLLFHGAPTWSDLRERGSAHWFWPAEPRMGVTS
ncbi:hypothetical protein [Jiangella asiatica]|uniref:Uncharacterized protein n=1 Tax=Jiangella asiatica TaxID=2530372 RepID=A0A4R5DNG6_9ACTN|nr:hypothetical protein [Jiangella asiatica]TDE15872.1 hypothetical protein E1269_00825 [Jiangella asiatica]